MKSKYLRFAANSLFTKGVLSPQRFTPKETFFRQDLRSARYFSLTTKNEWTFTSHFFPQTSFRGQRVSKFENSFSHLILGDKHIKWRGFDQKEMDESTNKELFGLIGREFKLSDFLIDLEQIQLAVDLKNLPKAEMQLSNTNQLSNSSMVAKSGSGVLFSAVHGSSILMRALKDQFTFKLEYNPLYVDQHLLSKALKEEYALLLNKFYHAVPLARKTPDCIEVKEFQALQREFYKKYGDEAGLCKLNKKAIENELGSSDTTPEHNAAFQVKI
jgi:hypothetical protein